MNDVTAGLEEAAERFAPQMDAIKDYAGSADEMIRQFAQERPVAAVAIAVGVGFLIGRLAAKL